MKYSDISELSWDFDQVQSTLILKILSEVSAYFLVTLQSFTTHKWLSQAKKKKKCKLHHKIGPWASTFILTSSSSLASTVSMTPTFNICQPSSNQNPKIELICPLFHSAPAKWMSPGFLQKWCLQSVEPSGIAPRLHPFQHIDEKVAFLQCFAFHSILDADQTVSMYLKFTKLSALFFFPSGPGAVLLLFNLTPDHLGDSMSEPLRILRPKDLLLFKSLRPLSLLLCFTGKTRLVWVTPTGQSKDLSYVNGHADSICSLPPLKKPQRKLHLLAVKVCPPGPYYFLTSPLMCKYLMQAHIRSQGASHIWEAPVLSQINKRRLTGARNHLGKSLETSQSEMETIFFHWVAFQQGRFRGKSEFMDVNDGKWTLRIKSMSHRMALVTNLQTLWEIFRWTDKMGCGISVDLMTRKEKMYSKAVDNTDTFHGKWWRGWWRG